MMAVWRDVTTRRVALIREFGLSETEVPSDGVTGVGVTVVGDKRAGFPFAELLFESQMLPRTFISWPDDEWRRKAADAIEGDWREASGSDTPA